MIKEIHLTNFKRFNSTSIIFKPFEVSILAGGNNSGKSSLLHALAVWEFCKLYLIYEKGYRALFNNFRGDGYGISFDDFTPINIPSLKYLWTNLKPYGGYSLKIKCVWDLPNKPDRFLEISLALTQERLFIKNTSSNLIDGDKTPTVAYLPPFAGISDREQWYSTADRKKLIGRGLAGAVLRNAIMEMFNRRNEERSKLKGNLNKIPSAQLQKLRGTNPFELLNKALFDVFRIQLEPHVFSPFFHNYVKVDIVKGKLENNRFKKFPNFSKRDLMVEGSGFLQWLSVYTFALDKEIDVLLLDEPDAHLHCSLQTLLLEKLVELSKEANKQVLMASHSTEILKHVEPKIIIEIKGPSAKYLERDSQKISLLSGLGTEYSPMINKLQKVKNVLFVENSSDANLLQIWCEKLNLKWPENLVVWPFANNHKERKQLFLHLKDEIKGIVGISLEDRDNSLYELTNEDLSDKSSPDWSEGDSSFKCRRWRRWEMENYLICTNSIAKAAKINEQTVKQFIVDTFSINISTDYLQSERSAANKPLFDEGKSIIEEIERHFKINKFDIAKNAEPHLIFDDVKRFINEIISICETS
jgi:predicted ATPase